MDFALCNVMALNRAQGGHVGSNNPCNIFSDINPRVKTCQSFKSTVHHQTSFGCFNFQHDSLMAHKTCPISTMIDQSQSQFRILDGSKLLGRQLLTNPFWLNKAIPTRNRLPSQILTEEDFFWLGFASNFPYK